MILVGGCLKMNGYNFVHPHKYFLNPSPKVKILTTNQFSYPIAGAASVLRVDMFGWLQDFPRIATSEDS